MKAERIYTNKETGVSYKIVIRMQHISDIMAKADKMIREEIDKEIEDINRQIVEL